MRQMRWFVSGLLAAGILAAGAAASRAAADKGGGVFPNDSGPKEIDVSGYPKEMQAKYKLFTQKCSACHTIARPINSQFLELSAGEIEKAKAEQPELYKDKNVIMPEEKIWSRYVRRMMAKPGCPVGRDGKAIWEFLSYDSKIRKTGAKGKAFAAARKKLLEDFKKSDPARYAELFSSSATAGK